MLRGQRRWIPTVEPDPGVVTRREERLSQRSKPLFFRACRFDSDEAHFVDVRRDLCRGGDGQYDITDRVRTLNGENAGDEVPEGMPQHDRRVVDDLFDDATSAASEVRSIP